MTVLHGSIPSVGPSTDVGGFYLLSTEIGLGRDLEGLLGRAEKPELVPTQSAPWPYLWLLCSL